MSSSGLKRKHSVLHRQPALLIKVEIWDTSGDKKYESCWPAITKEASGMIMVYDPNIRTQERDIELWHKAFVQPLKLADSQVLVCAHQADAVGKRSWQPPRSLEKVHAPYTGGGIREAMVDTLLIAPVSPPPTSCRATRARPSSAAPNTPHV